MEAATACTTRDVRSVTHTERARCAHAARTLRARCAHAARTLRARVRPRARNFATPLKSPTRVQNFALVKRLIVSEQALRTRGKIAKTNGARARGLAKDVKLANYIAKIAKALSLEEGKSKMTMSAAALAEVELLVSHAVDTITTNAGAILRYSGTETLGVKTAAAATGVAFSGLLRGSVQAAGLRAVEKYEAAVKPKSVCV
jgi:hypothetical protein